MTTINTHAGVFTISNNGTSFVVTGPSDATFDATFEATFDAGGTVELLAAAYSAACNFCYNWALTNEVHILRLRGEDLEKGIVTVNADWKAGAANNAALVQNALNASFPPTVK
jgi:hypothetical protein